MKTARYLAIAALLAWAVSPVGAASPVQPMQAKNKTVKNPKAGSLYGAILGGLQLVKDGKFDQWISTYCDPKKLCPTPRAKKALKKYNLTQLRKQAGYCLQKDGKSLVVTRQVKANKGEKVFIKCNPKGSPKPFTLQKTGDRWYWITVPI